MKKIFLSVALLFPLAVMAQQPFTIKGEIKNLKDGDKIYLVYAENGQRITDSTIVANGTFEFKGAAKDPSGGNIFKKINPYVRGTDTRFMDFAPLYIEPGNIIIKSVDSVKSAIVSGTSTNNDNTKLSAKLKVFNDQMEALNNEYTKLSPAQMQDQALVAKLRGKAMKIAAEMTPVSLAFAKENPKSFVSLMTLAQLSGNAEVAGEVAIAFEGLSPELKSSTIGERINAVLEGEKKTRIGTVTDFTQNDQNGKPVKLSDFKGKYVLVDFWASWCGPCRNENPNVVSAFNKYKDKNFTVLGVSLDKPGEKQNWLDAIAEDKLTWTHVSDLKHWQNEVSMGYGVQSIPFNFLVDPTGKIIAKNLREEALQTKLAELLDGKTN